MKSFGILLLLCSSIASGATYLERVAKAKGHIGEDFIIPSGYWKGCHLMVTGISAEEGSAYLIYWGKSTNCPIERVEIRE